MAGRGDRVKKNEVGVAVCSGQLTAMQEDLMCDPGRAARGVLGAVDFPPGDVVLQVRSGEDVLAHLDLYVRSVGVGSTEVLVAAIGQVATDPGYRGLGLASSLVRTAHLIAATRGLEWAALFGVSTLYERIGYRTPPDPPRADFQVCPLVDGADWPDGAIDTRGLW